MINTKLKVLFLVLTLTLAGASLLYWNTLDSHAQAVAVPAFAGAEGFGANSLGGRGGRAIEVTNLNDSGNGSLRACIDATGPRTCIFKVGGTITLFDGLRIENPFITIAGQTAPGGGILLKNDPSNTDRSITISTNDVIVRYIRTRPGPSTDEACCLDGLSIYSGTNVIVDHVSSSWSTDGNLDIGTAENITIQWSIISEGLKNSSHTKGSHSTGMLISPNVTNSAAKNISVHHNYYAHNNERNPRIASLNPGPLDFVNNIIYNPGSTSTVVSAENGPVNLNYVNNYIREGIESVGIATVRYPIAVSSPLSPIRIYLSGNNMFNRDADVNTVTEGFLRPGDRGNGYTVAQPFPAASVTTYPTAALLTQVLPNVGAIKPIRDSVDARLVTEVVNGTGFIPELPSDVGGWPTIAAGTGYTDTDIDGMPNTWETQFGLNANSAADGPLDLDNDGYTNLEEFLNETLPNSASNASPGSSPSPGSPDVDGDGSIGPSDFTAMFASWVFPTNQRADINGDGKVNSFDFAKVLFAIMTPSPTPIASASPTPLPSPSPAATPLASVSPSASPGNFTLTGFTLVNSTTNTDIRPFVGGDTLNLGANPAVSLRVAPSSTTIKSVRFVMTGTTTLDRHDNDVPLAIATNTASPLDYSQWNIQPGQYTLTATPFSNANATGLIGTPVTINFQVVNSISTTIGSWTSLAAPSVAISNNLSSDPIDTVAVGNKIYYSAYFTYNGIQNFLVASADTDGTNFSEWTALTNPPSTLGGPSVSAIASDGNKLYVCAFNVYAGTEKLYTGSVNFDGTGFSGWQTQIAPNGGHSSGNTGQGFDMTIANQKLYYAAYLHDGTTSTAFSLASSNLDGTGLVSWTPMTAPTASAAPNTSIAIGHYNNDLYFAAFAHDASSTTATEYFATAKSSVDGSVFSGWTTQVAPDGAGDAGESSFIDMTILAGKLYFAAFVHSSATERYYTASADLDGTAMSTWALQPNPDGSSSNDVAAPAITNNGARLLMSAFANNDAIMSLKLAQP